MEETLIPVPEEQRLQAQQNALTLTKHAGGRPSSITPRVVTNLIAYFQRGITITKACEMARITRRAFYDRYKADEEFRYEIDDARNYWVSLAGDTITDLLRDKDKETLALRVNTAKWIYEKKMPEEYGPKSAQVIGQQNTQQNNFFVLNNGQISELTKQPDIIQGDPSELFETLEEASDVDAGAEEERIT